ncbi:MAG: S24 family peptidase [Thermonemataceae bacterium]|nr:S24 family peptidase [Thermonemataceae bacterium]
MENIVNEQLKKFVQHLGISIREFERNIGTSNGAIAKALKNNLSIGSNTIKDIFYHYPDLSAEFIFKGTGEMFNTQLIIPPKVARKVYISPEPAMAGNPFGYITEGNEEIEHFYLPFLKKTGTYAAFRVQGRSMEEYIEEGSWVICRLLEEAAQVLSGNVYLIATRSEGLLLKRIYIQAEHRHKGLILYSDNPLYAPFFLHNEEILKVWAVEMFLKTDFPPNTDKWIKDNLKAYIDTLSI